uniref:RING-type domain-containing protein n=1 Tax=Anopheles maculatus TaxID=74869 RepID=A0A182SSH4_9DIPT
MIPIGGAIRALMMGIHAYFNIWCEARAGWVVFMKRRTAVHKISSLPEATTAQLHQFDDVCAICYQDMTSAKITRCNHYFHGVCLRKWLYVQDRCPLCHEIIMNQDGNSGDESIEEHAANNIDNARAEGRIGRPDNNETNNRQPQVAPTSILHGSSSDQADEHNQPLFDDMFLEEQITNHNRAASAGRTLGGNAIGLQDTTQVETARRSTLLDQFAGEPIYSRDHMRFERPQSGKMVNLLQAANRTETGQSSSGLLLPLLLDNAQEESQPSESGSSYASTSDSISSSNTEATGGSSSSGSSTSNSGG